MARVVQCELKDRSDINLLLRLRYSRFSAPKGRTNFMGWRRQICPSSILLVSIANRSMSVSPSRAFVIDCGEVGMRRGLLAITTMPGGTGNRRLFLTSGVI